MMELKTTRYFILILLGIFIQSSCYYDVEEEIYGTTGCSTANMSYVQDILPIIDINCYTCHNQSANNGNVTLEGHPALLVYVNNDRLLGSIKHQPGFSAMPQNRSKLLDCEIDKIEAWVNQGALNN